MVRPWVNSPWTSLGTDGFGRSDTREQLRRFFEIDQAAIEIAALSTLARSGTIEAAQVNAAIERHHVDPDATPPWIN